MIIWLDAKINIVSVHKERAPLGRPILSGAFTLLFLLAKHDPFEKVSDAAQDAIDAELANTASHMEPTVERDEKGSTR